MNGVYLDTNIFIYLSDKKSTYHKTCISLIEYCKNKNLQILTSTETFQEIIYLSHNLNQISNGLKTALHVQDIVNEILSVDRRTIELYLKLIAKYKSITSRDVLHLSVILTYDIKSVISYDKHFKKFDEAFTVTPQEFLKLKAL